MTPDQQMKHMAMLLTALTLKYGKSDLLGKSGAVELELTNEELTPAMGEAGVIWNMMQEPVGDPKKPDGIRLKLVRGRAQ